MADLFDFAVSTVEIRGIVWQLFLEVKLPKNMKGSSLRSHLGLKFSIFALPGIDGVDRWCLKAWTPWTFSGYLWAPTCPGFLDGELDPEEAKLSLEASGLSYVR